MPIEEMIGMARQRDVSDIRPLLFAAADALWTAESNYLTMRSDR